MNKPIQHLPELDHSNNLLKNDNRYIQDNERAIKRFAETSYKFYGAYEKNKIS
jgi:hypothetical protein